MTPSHRGIVGEVIALHYLRRYGYRLVNKNFRCAYGEIDLIVTHGRDICFVEVKSWQRFAYEEVSQAINRKKQSRIILGAYLFLEANKQFISYRPQLSVLFINLQTGLCRYVKSAFEEEYGWHELRD